MPEGILERPLPLRTATGNSVDVVTTSSSEARAYYLQGLNYLHGYAWIEGARSFQQAIRLDPNLAMAHWGLSRIYSGLDDHAGAVSEATRARELGERSERRASSGASRCACSSSSRLRISATRPLFAAYKQAIDRAIAADIDDVELWLIRGNAEEPTAAGRGQRGGAASTAFYQEALRLAPRERRRASLPHALVRKPEPDRARARTRRGVCAHRRRHSARAPHVGTRSAACRPARRGHRGVHIAPTSSRTRTTRRRRFRPGARLAPRAQPRSARDVARAQGADAQAPRRCCARRRP